MWCSPLKAAVRSLLKITNLDSGTTSAASEKITTSQFTPSAVSTITRTFCSPSHQPLSKVVQTLKAYSSKWLNDEIMKNGRFTWQEGYAAFSVSQSNVAAVEDYIRHQPEHHKNHAFEDELKSLLIRHGVAFDDRYVLG